MGAVHEGCEQAIRGCLSLHAVCALNLIVMNWNDCNLKPVCALQVHGGTCMHAAEPCCMLGCSAERMEPG